MRAAITALSWELLARYRWVSVLSAGWVVFVCAMGMLLSRIGLDPQFGVGLVLSLGGPLLFVAASFAHGFESHLENAGSCFPSRLFTLPISSRFLVGPPLLLGTLVVVVAWLLSVLCLLRPFGLEEVPLWWPALCGAAALAWLQALTWFPFPLPWLRLGCVTVFLFGLSTGTAALVHFSTDEALLAGLYLTLLLTAYAIALTGVYRARQGLGRREAFQLGAITVQRGLHAPRPFSSPLRAQLWFDGRLHGWVFLFMSALCLVVALPSMTFAYWALQSKQLNVFAWIAQARESVGDSWLVMSYLLLAPFLIALCAGPEMGKVGLHVTDNSCPPFLGTRPMSIADMIKAKLIVGAGGLLCSWIMLFTAALCWAVWMGRISEMGDRLSALTGSTFAANRVVSSLQLVGVLVAGQLLLFAITWLRMASGLWLGAWGRPTLTGVIVLGSMFGAVGAVCLLVIWHVRGWPLFDVFLDGSIVACIASKTLAVCWVIRQLLQERLLQPRTLIHMVYTWALLAASVVAIAVWLIPNPARWAGASLLLLPLARPLAAPLALARNRTR
jgi:hypothetical protein